MTAHNMAKRRLVIITNELGAADSTLSHMMGFAISISMSFDILIVCDEKLLKDKSTLAEAVDLVESTGRRYGLDVCVELYCKSRILNMRDDLNNKRGLSMVLLSPALNNNRVLDLKQILKDVPVPIWQYRNRTGGTHHEQVKETVTRG
ncbi:MAG: hypothetical protein L7F77_01345 [Candidatus Magnetominusculus sp. LBB02]|nr:hypothetical protein [Candidatus Magnetominusculus sp. LBB02]